MDRVRKSGGRGGAFRRAAACTLGALIFVGAAASPAFADTPPDQVAPAPAVTRGNGTLIVAFTAPNDNGFPIDFYSAVCQSSNGGPLGSNTDVASPVTVTPGVGSNGKLYHCHVLAHNSGDFSVPSDDSSPEVVLASVPDPPAAPGVTPGATTISVAFAAPANNGDAITGYQADCNSGNGGAAGSNTGATSPIVVPTLTPLKTYACTVTASNTIGAGAPSNPSSSTVVGSPGTPPTPTVMAGNAQITVTFGAANDNGNAIDSYFATCHSSNGGPLGSASGAASPIVVPVANAKIYNCYVIAHDAAGFFGPQSADSTAVTPGGAPDAPDPPTVAPANHSVVVTFVAPNDNGSPITSYEADCDSSDGGVSGTKTGAASPLTVTGLTNGNTYTCSVIAFNVVGGATSTDSAPVVPLAVPAAPPKPTVTIGNARIIVNFDTPADNGDPVFAFTASCTSSNGGVARTKDGFFSPIAVTGLTNGKSYTCRAAATNDIGTGPFSVPSNAVIPRSPPGVPTGLVVNSGPAPGSTGSLTVSFTPGPSNGTPITSYRATCRRVNTGAVKFKTSTSTSIAVTGLVAGQAYACNAVAISLGGTSPTTPPIVRKVGTPGPPAITKILKQAQQVTLFFVPGAANGKPITLFTARCSSTNGGVSRGKTSPGSPVLVKQMTPGTTYTCILTPTNARGDGTPTKVGPITIPSA